MIGFRDLQEYLKSQASEDKERAVVNTSGENLQEALRDAAIELGLPIKKIEYEVLEPGSKGVLGMGKKPCLILAYPAKQEAVAATGESFDFGIEDPELAEDRNGEACVRLSPDGILLKVLPPKGSGVRVSTREALQRIQERTRNAVDEALVAKVVKLAEGEFVRVGEFDYDPANDAVMSVDITEDEMKAYLTVQPPGPGGADPEYESVVSFLQSNGVVEGILEDAVQRFCDNPEFRRRILVAEGPKAQNGADAKIIYSFEEAGKKVRLKEKEGKVDFKELNTIQNVVEGQVLAKKQPPEKGSPGRTVTGMLIPAKDGRDVSIQVGKNVRLSEDGRSAVADINGQVMIQQGKINVEPVYTVNGDVNLKSGNILFLGGVVVKGNVDDGFSVKAAGNIEVMGSVGKCTLDAEGDVIVHQGIAGKGQGVVKAGGNVWSKFIENSNIEASGLVVVSDGIINSTVFSDKKIICKGKRASIVGGRLRAAEEIDAKTLGSVAGMETTLEVGYDPKAKERLGNLESKMEEIDKSLDEVKLNLNTLSNLKKVKKKLPEDKEKYLNELTSKKQELDLERGKMEKESEEIKNYLSQLKTTGRVSASGTVYPGVKVNIRDLSLPPVQIEYRSVTFIADGANVKPIKYEESDEDISVIRRS